MKRIALLLAVISLFAGCRKEVLPDAVALNRHSLSLEVGETYALEATVTPANVTNPSLNWSSTQPSVATVDPDGTVKALSEGQAIITATTLSGGKTDACSVTVTKKAAPDPGHNDTIESVTISPATLEVAEGLTAQLKATVSPASASQEVEWASQDTGIATVDDNGVVTGVAKGTTKVLARSKANHDKQGVCEVTVIQDPTLRGISFNVTEITLTVGQSYTMTVVYTPEYAANKKVSWKSSDSSVASVSSEGKVVGISEGTATVAATSEEGGFTASCSVTVGKSAGVKVYYSLYGDQEPLYVNGAPDPRTGSFEEIVDFDQSSVRFICSEGSDLYSIERLLLKGKTGSKRYYLCKNRKPLYEIPVSSSVPNFYGMSMHNGTMAVVEWPSDSKDYFAIIITPDGTATTSKITGSFSKLEYVNCVWAQDGYLHIITQMTDPYHEEYVADYTYSQDGNWIETIITKGEMLSSTSSDEGDVYLVFYRNSDKSVVLYKNGKPDSIIETDIGANLKLDLCVTGGHVYTVINEVNDGKITERCDGKVIQTLVLSNEYLGTKYHSLYVTASGDTFLSSWHSVFKNDKLLYHIDEKSLDNFCVIE